ncbi:MAG TPA: hypothetical protein VF669_18270 [Tepidisphaeraceae bacterium]|jgi:hypothetical protein
MNALKILPRELVTKWYGGDRPLDEDAVHDAIVEMMRRGWLPSFVPRPSEWDRTMVFLPQRSNLAAIVRYLDGGGIGVVPRGLIESRTQFPISCIGTGLVLSSIGIAILRVDGNNVFIRSTTPALALMVHSARIHTLDGLPTNHLIRVATGKRVPSRCRTDDLRLRVALRFDELAVDVPGVLDGKSESDVRSRWQFPPTAAKPADPEIPF